MRKAQFKIDQCTPAQRRWLDRWEATCYSRRRTIYWEGSFLKLIKVLKTRGPQYGYYAMDWKYVKSEVVRCERRDRRKAKIDAERNLGVFI